MEETGLNVKIVKLLDTINVLSIYKKDDKYKLYLYLAESLDDNQNHDKHIESTHITLNWINYQNVENVLSYDVLKEFYKKHFDIIEEYILNNE